MTRFLAALAVACVVAFPARADEACQQPMAAAYSMVHQGLNAGLEVKVIDGHKAQKYLSVVRPATNVPDIQGARLFIIILPGQAALMIVVNSEKACGAARLAWDLHEEALRAADGAQS